MKDLHRVSSTVGLSIGQIRVKTHQNNKIHNNLIIDSVLTVYIFSLFQCQAVRIAGRTNQLLRVILKFFLHLKLHYSKISNF
jgi:hypothetical protein